MAGLLTAVLVLSGCLSGGSDPTEGVETQSIVPLTPFLDIPLADRAVKEWDIYAGFTTFEPVEGKTLSALTFKLDPEDAGTVPGPELRVTQGDRVKVTLHVDAGLPHTIHWHGISLPWEMDGVPFMTQSVSMDAFEYVYEFNADEAGTYWYHCHVDAPTHVDFGLFGALIVEPRDPKQDPPFDRESTVLLHEIDSQSFLHGDRHPPKNPGDLPNYGARYAREAIDIAGIIAGESGLDFATSAGPRDYYPLASLRYHPYYDTFMINGKSFPETEPLHVESGETIRIRMINAGQLLHTMHLHGHHFLVTHKDGYNLPVPYYADSIVIGPGERYDVYVKANNPGIWDFHDHGGSWELGGYTSNDHAFPGGMNTMLVYDDFEFADLPGPAHAHTSGDYMAFAKSYRGRYVPEDRLREVAHHH
ncbi:MAG: multicopper oxidase family protein [Methanobacteriota archaeon]